MRKPVRWNEVRRTWRRAALLGDCKPWRRHELLLLTPEALGTAVGVGRVGVGVERCFVSSRPLLPPWGPRAPPRGVDLVGGGEGSEGGKGGVVVVNGGDGPVATSCD